MDPSRPTSDAPPREDGATSDSDDALLRAFARAPAVAPPPPASGSEAADPERVAHFRVVARIGRGGMGVVYRAEDEKLRREVALKLLPRAFVRDEERRARFVREARLAAAIAHANVAQVYEVGESEGRVFIAMELVSGETLRRRLERGRLAAGEAVRIARAIARALARAHAKGIVHRDLKPENLMIDDEGEVKILDFGLAKAREAIAAPVPLPLAETAPQDTAEGRVLGTPGYMSPEQAKGRGVDHRTDLFALGVVLYEMLTGERPFHGDTPLDVIIAVSRDPPASLASKAPGVSPAIEALVARLLAKAPDERYANARDVVDAIDAVTGAAPGDSGDQPGAPAPAAPRPSRAAAIAIVLATVVAAAGVAARWRASHAPDALAPPVASTPPATAITDLPSPATPSPEAAAAFRAALQSLRDGSVLRAIRDLTRAASLDATFAAPRVQLLLIGDVLSLDEQRRHSASAWQARTSLSARDAAVLEVARADLAVDTPDLQARYERWKELVARYPGDAELALAAALRAVDAGHVDDARALLAAARAIDPSFAWPDAVLARIALDEGDLEGASAAADRCLAASPSASACLDARADVAHQRGECAALESQARRMIAADPDDPGGYRWLETALTALDAPSQAIVEARLHGSEHALDPALRAWNALVDPTIAPWLDGDFAAVAAHFPDWDRFRATATSEAQVRGMTFGEMYTYEESGDAAHVVAVAEDYLNRSSAFTQDETAAGRYFALAAKRRAKRLGDAEVRATRDAWIRHAVARISPRRRAEIWFSFYANAVRTPDEAREALAALPAYEPVTAIGLDFVEEFYLGNVYFLAGDRDAALPHLRRSTSLCANLFGMTERVRALEELGEVLESKGDRGGACAAYGAVLGRWGNAKPRSITADAARPRAKRLGCAPR